MQKLERIITKKEKQKIKLDAGWYSEAEMKSELKWGPPAAYTKFVRGGGRERGRERERERERDRERERERAMHTRAHMD